MVDIFISYARRDLQQVTILANALKAIGWSVWWDSAISPGSPIDPSVEGPLRSARCVLVAWSAAARESDWVRDEASVGRERGVLVPVLIEQVEIPLSFRQYLAADLTTWRGSDDHVGFIRLCEALFVRLGKPTIQQFSDSVAVFTVGKEFCDFADVATAAREVPAYSLLDIRPGDYSGLVIIDKPLHLSGAKGGSETKLQAVGTVLKISAQCALSNLTIASSGHTNSIISLEADSLTISNSTIEGEHAIECLRAIGRVKTTLSSCKVHGGQFGCVAGFQSELNLIDTTVSDASKVGVLVDESSDLSLYKCRITACGQNGVSIYGRSRGRIELTEITKNALIGIEVKHEGSIRAVNNEIRWNGQGIRLSDKATGEIKSNRIQDSELSGIHVLKGSYPTVRNNEISRCNGNGVIVFDRGKGVFEENVIRECRGHGIEVRESSEVTLVGNHIQKSGLDGLRIAKSAKVFVSGDQVTYSGNNGAFVCEESHLELIDASVVAADGCGVLIHTNGHVRMERTRIIQNRLSGLEAKQGTCSVSDCRILENRTNGMWLKEGATGELSDSTIANSTLTGMRLEEQAEGNIQNCEITESQQHGIVILSNSRLACSNSVIERNEWAGVYIGENSGPVFRSNVIRNNRQGGIFIDRQGGGLVERNIFEGNKPGDVLITIPASEVKTHLAENTSDTSKIMWKEASDDSI